MTLRPQTSTLPETASARILQTMRAPGSGTLSDTLTGTAELVLPSSVATVDRMEQETEQFALTHGFSEDDAANIAMAAREATVNAVMHGNGYSQDKQVHISLTCDARSLTLTIRDQGAGFNAALLPDPLSPENILRSSGRGVFLMRALMDEVHFRQLNPGTELVLTKYRTSAPDSK